VKFGVSKRDSHLIIENKTLIPCSVCFYRVQRLVRICGEVRAGPSENDEVLFLCTLCAKIKADPYLVNFFIEVNHLWCELFK
jgi:hypothetical protein